MAIFYNQATLTYNDTVTNSNIVTGEIVEALAVEKNVVADGYRPGDILTYVISLTNSGSATMSNLTLTDDLGTYTPDTVSFTPLTYVEGSVRYYLNGVLQEAPTVTAGPPLVLGGIDVPAGGNAIVIYRAAVNDYAAPTADSCITNAVTVTGNALTPIMADNQVCTDNSALLSITKALSPTTVSDNEAITYTFVIRNTGNTPVVATDDATVTDLFSPILSDLRVTFNGTPWSDPTDYTYDAATGAFATVPGKITVPAATYTQDPETGLWAIEPGTVTLVVTGTI